MEWRSMQIYNWGYKGYDAIYCDTLEKVFNHVLCHILEYTYTINIVVQYVIVILPYLLL